MAKQWYFFDSSNARRLVKSAYFYDDTGARRAVKAGYFYDSLGERKQFFAGGLQPPAQGYYPGSNFSMKAGENSVNTGFQGGSFGEIKPDSGAGAATFPLYPTTVADPHLAQMLYCVRNKSTSVFDMYFYRSPFTNPAADTKFWAYNILNQNGSVYDSLPRETSTEILDANSITHRWSYVLPFTVGSNYTFKAHERAANTTITAGSSGGNVGFSNGVAQAAFGSCANQMLTTRVGWNIAGFYWFEADEEAVFQLQGPSGASDPGKGFLAYIKSNSGVSTKVAYADGYSWNPTTRIAEWWWMDSGTFLNGQTYTVEVG